MRTHLPYRCTYVGIIGRALVATVTMRPPAGVSISLLTMIRRGLLPFALAHGHRAVRRLFTLKNTYDALESRLARGQQHWLVHMMAVDPSRQGKGLGTHLLNRVLDTAVAPRATGSAPPAVLTTHKQRNVIFYQRAGFVVDRVEDVSLMGDAPRSSADATGRRRGFHLALSFSPCGRFVTALNLLNGFAHGAGLRGNTCTARLAPALFPGDHAYFIRPRRRCVKVKHAEDASTHRDEHPLAAHRVERAKGTWPFAGSRPR
jgi:GNAT superfamily N-acetyltransferase